MILILMLLINFVQFAQKINLVQWLNLINFKL
jgi:hypothetical protein